MDQTVIICMPRDAQPVPPVPSGSAWCHSCGAEVWLSIPLMARRDEAVLRCLRCHIHGDQRGHYMIVPEQEADLEAHGALESSRDLVERLNRKD